MSADQQVYERRRCVEHACGPQLFSSCLLCMQAAQGDACDASVDDLFPQYRNVTLIKQQLDAAPAAVKAAIPNPLVGFTLFLASDSALNNGAGVCERAVAVFKVHVLVRSRAYASTMPGGLLRTWIGHRGCQASQGS